LKNYSRNVSHWRESNLAPNHLLSLAYNNNGFAQQQQPIIFTHAKPKTMFVSGQVQTIGLYSQRFKRFKH